MSREEHTDALRLVRLGAEAIARREWDEWEQLRVELIAVADATNDPRMERTIRAYEYAIGACCHASIFSTPAPRSRT